MGDTWGLWKQTSYLRYFVNFYLEGIFPQRIPLIQHHFFFQWGSDYIISEDSKKKKPSMFATFILKYFFLSHVKWTTNTFSIKISPWSDRGKWNQVALIHPVSSLWDFSLLWLVPLFQLRLPHSLSPVFSWEVTHSLSFLETPKYFGSPNV